MNRASRPRRTNLSRTGYLESCARHLLLIAAVQLLLLSWSVSSALAQGAWQQQEFVIGTWVNPLRSSNNPALTRRYFGLARDAHFNLLTGTQPATEYFLSPDLTAGPNIARATLDAAAEAGMQLLASDQHWRTWSETDSVPCWSPETCPYGNVPPELAENVLKDHLQLNSSQSSALMGFTLGDEPNPTRLTGVPAFLRGWMKQMHQADEAGPPRAVHINLHANVPNNPPLYYPTYRDYVNEFTNDPDPEKQVDVISATLYPFNANGTFVTAYYLSLKTLRDAMWPRPFWAISQITEHIDQTNYNFVLSESQIRMTAFAPVAAGAKGIIWFTYTELDPRQFDAAANFGIIPTCKYYTVKTINHYLKEIVGPAVMNSTHLGQFHQAVYPAGVAIPAAVPNPATADCPVYDLDNPHFAVGVFRPNNAPNDYLLCIYNKHMIAQTGVVKLGSSWSVSAAPSVVGYVGGQSYAPVATGNQFTVTLQGGEGRMYRLSPAPTAGLRLTSPVGGTTWLPGAHTVTWEGSVAPVTIRLFTNPLGTTSGITGPSVILASNVTGNQAVVQIPSTSSRRARIVISAIGVDQVEHTATHSSPISTAPAPSQISAILTPEPAGSGHCSLQANMVLDNNGLPHLAYYSNPNTLHHSFWNGSTWNRSLIQPFIFPSYFGLCPALAIDAQNYRHALYVFGNPETESVGLRTTPAYVGYQSNRPGWPELDILGTALCDDVGGAITTGPDGTAYMAFGRWAGSEKQLTVDKRPLVEGYAASVPADPRSISMATDGANTIWIAFIDDLPVPSKLRVLRIAPAGGQVAESQEWEGNFGEVSLTLHSGLPRIIYTERNPTDGSDVMRYRSYAAGAWLATSEIIDGGPSRIDGIALRFQSASARVAYAGNGVLKYAQPLGAGNWSVTTLVAGADIGGPVNLGYSSAGVRYVSYFDRTADALRVARRPVGSSDPIEEEPPIVQQAIEMPAGSVIQSGQGVSVQLVMPRPTRIAMSLHDVAGRRVAHRPTETVDAGRKTLQWRPQGLASGVYFLRVAAEGGIERKARIILLR
jgi:hypothetical protein